MGIFSRKKKSTEVSKEEVFPNVIKPSESEILSIAAKDVDMYDIPLLEHFNWCKDYLDLDIPYLSKDGRVNTDQFIMTLARAIMIKACKDYLTQEKISQDGKMKSKDTIGVVLNINKTELFDEISEEMSIDEALTLILKSYKFVDSDLIVDQIMKILEDEVNYR